jgi:hypothetical protein
MALPIIVPKKLVKLVKESKYTLLVRKDNRQRIKFTKLIWDPNPLKVCL